ncbi:hypothetical protein DPEC_G00373630 [Dallia pectoralis]|nr:hypothetical protein DPEC_G00373630 [Dallia pectoralis]
MVSCPLVASASLVSRGRKSDNEKHIRRSLDHRSSCGDLVDDSSGGVSITGSISSMPSCLPFSWFGSQEGEREGEEKASLCLQLQFTLHDHRRQKRLPDSGQWQ